MSAKKAGQADESIARSAPLGVAAPLPRGTRLSLTLGQGLAVADHVQLGAWLAAIDGFAPTGRPRLARTLMVSTLAW